jgi:hypothetical protein
MDRVLSVVDFDHRGEERAAFEVRLAEPFGKDVEYGQKLLARGPPAPAALGFQPLAGPELLTAAQEVENQVVLGGELR